jgi:hypothetical protein
MFEFLNAHPFSVIMLSDMIKSDIANLIVPVLLGLTACFGYYQGFLTLITRRYVLNAGKTLTGLPAVLVGFIMLVSAIIASGIAIIFYISGQ